VAEAVPLKMPVIQQMARTAHIIVLNMRDSHRIVRSWTKLYRFPGLHEDWKQFNQEMNRR
jgi:hypothetical protein